MIELIIGIIGLFFVVIELTFAAVVLKYFITAV